VVQKEIDGKNILSADDSTYKHGALFTWLDRLSSLLRYGFLTSFDYLGFDRLWLLRSSFLTGFGNLGTARGTWYLYQHHLRPSIGFFGQAFDQLQLLSYCFLISFWVT
jgi:hypothetical protein